MNTREAAVTLNDKDLKTITGGEETDPPPTEQIKRIPIYDGWGG